MSRKIAFKIFLSLLLLSMFFVIGVVKAEEPIVCAVFFTKPSGCPICSQADSYVSDLISECEGRFVVIEYEIRIDKPENSVVFAEYDATYNCGIVPPVILFGMNDLLHGEEISLDALRSKINGYLNSGNNLPLANGSSVAFEDLNVNNLPGYPIVRPSGDNSPSRVPTFLAVIAAAAVDSVNPCEFAVLVILLSGVIASEGRKKALKMGLAFVFAVFVMYLLMGLGIFSIIMVSEVAIYFRKAIAVFAIIVGLLNVKDYFWKDAKGALSTIPESWRPKVQKLLDEATSVPGALFSGFLVGIFLLPCSSGPYAEALALLTYETMKIYAIQMILLYNFIFILPMIGIVLAIYFGLTTTAKAAHWRHKRVRLLHLIAGILMFSMGIWMLFFF